MTEGAACTIAVAVACMTAVDMIVLRMTTSGSSTMTRVTIAGNTSVAQCYTQRQGLSGLFCFIVPFVVRDFAGTGAIQIIMAVADRTVDTTLAEEGAVMWTAGEIARARKCLGFCVSSIGL